MAKRLAEELCEIQSRASGERSVERLKINKATLPAVNRIVDAIWKKLTMEDETWDEICVRLKREACVNPETREASVYIDVAILSHDIYYISDDRIPTYLSFRFSNWDRQFENGVSFEFKDARGFGPSMQSEHVAIRVSFQVSW